MESKEAFNVYTIEKHYNCSSDNCPLKCTQCNIWVHTFSCTYPDSQMHYTICKHVHLVAQQIGINQEQSCSHNVSLQIPKSDFTLQTTLLNKFFLIELDT